LILWCKNQKDGTNAMVKLTVSDRFMQALSVYIKRKPIKHDLRDIVDGIFLFYEQGVIGVV
jgi:hypothetical protein